MFKVRKQALVFLVQHKLLYPPWDKVLQLLEKELWRVCLQAVTGEMGWGLVSDISLQWISKTHPAFSLDANPKTSISIHLLLGDSFQQRFQNPTESHANNGSCFFLSSECVPSHASTRYSKRITSLRSTISQVPFTVSQLRELSIGIVTANILLIVDPVEVN